MKKAVISVFLATMLVIVSVLTPFLSLAYAKEGNISNNATDTLKSNPSLKGGWFLDNHLIQNNSIVSKDKTLSFKFYVNEELFTDTNSELSLQIIGSNNTFISSTSFNPGKQELDNEEVISHNKVSTSLSGDSLQDILGGYFTASMKVYSTDGQPVHLQAVVKGNEGKLHAMQPITLQADKVSTEEHINELITLAAPQLTSDKGVLVKDNENTLLLSFKNTHLLSDADKQLIIDYIKQNEKESPDEPVITAMLSIPAALLTDEEQEELEDMQYQKNTRTLFTHDIEQLLNGKEVALTRTELSNPSITKEMINGKLNILHPSLENTHENTHIVELNKEFHLYNTSEKAKHAISVKMVSDVAPLESIKATLRATNDSSQKEQVIHLDEKGEWKQTLEELPFFNQNNERINYELMIEKQDGVHHVINYHHTPQEVSKEKDEVYEETLIIVKQTKHNIKKDVKVEVVLDELTEEQRKVWLTKEKEPLIVLLSVSPQSFPTEEIIDKENDYLVALNDGNNWQHTFKDVVKTNHLGVHYDTTVYLMDAVGKDKDFKYVIKGDLANSELYRIYVVAREDNEKDTEDNSNDLPHMSDVVNTPPATTTIVVKGDLPNVTKAKIITEDNKTVVVNYDATNSNTFDLPFLVAFDKNYSVEFLNEKEEVVDTHTFFVPKKEGTATDIITITLNNDTNDITNDDLQTIHPITVKVEFKEVTPPENVTVTLTQNNTPFLQQKISKENDWTVIFKDLPLLQVGTNKKANYFPLINGVDLKKNEVVVTGNAADGFVITVSSVATSQKEKEDQKDKDIDTHTIPLKMTFDESISPEQQKGVSTVVQLHKDNDEFVTLASLNALNNWQYQYEGLPFEDEQGKPIHYYVKDVGIAKNDKYSVELSGDKEKGFVVHVTPSKTDGEKPSVEKQEEDKEDTSNTSSKTEEEKEKDTADELTEEEIKQQQKEKNEELEKTKEKEKQLAAEKEKKEQKRLEKLLKEKQKLSLKVIFDEYAYIPSIPVEIVADGKVVKNVTLSSENDWKMVIEDLNKYNKDTKEEINYSIQVSKHLVDSDKYHVDIKKEKEQFTIHVQIKTLDEDLLGTHTTCNDFSIYVQGIGDDEEVKKIKVFERDGKTLIDEGELDELYSFKINHPLVVGEAYIVRLTHKGETKETVMQFTDDVCGYSINFSKEEPTVKTVDDTSISSKPNYDANYFIGGGELTLDKNIQPSGQQDNSNDFLLDKEPENMSLEEKHSGEKTLFGKKLPQMNTVQTLLPLTIGAIMLGSAFAYRLASRKEKKMFKK